MTAPRTAIRLIGFCAICEQDHKLTADELLVHHGYRRPGDGRIHGDCLAVGRGPYERTAAPLIEYREVVSKQAGRLADRIAEIRTASWFERVRPSRRHGAVTISYSIGVTPEFAFLSARESFVRELQHAFDACIAEAARLTKWIDAWALKPIRTEEELIRVATERRAEQQARVNAAREAKAAKRAAIDAKHAAREARVLAEQQAIIAEAKRLTAAATEPYSKPALGLLKRITKCDRGWWVFKAGIDAELIALGIAYRGHGGHLSLRL